MIPFELFLLVALAAAFLLGLAWGLVLARVLRGRVEAGRRGGEIDLTGRRL